MGRDDRKKQGDIMVSCSRRTCLRDELYPEQLVGSGCEGGAGPLDEEVKSCLEGGRQEAKGEVDWGHPAVEVRRKSSLVDVFQAAGECEAAKHAGLGKGKET